MARNTQQRERRTLADVAPSLALEAYGWDPAAVTPKANKRLPWKCGKPECGYIWETTPGARHGLGTGCPACAGQRARPGINSLATLHPDIAAEAYGWDPDHILPNSGKRLEWQCRECDFRWHTIVANRVRYHSGCPACAGQCAYPGVRSLATTHPHIAAEAYGWDPDTVLAGSSRRVTWECKECQHHWTTTPTNRTGPEKTGCPACSGRVAIPGVRSLAVHSPTIAAEAHGWDPDQVAPYSNKKRLWRCQACQHEWNAAPQSRTSMGTGCPRCHNTAYRPNDPAWLYLNEVRDITGKLIAWKIGVAHNIKRRVTMQSRRANGYTIRTRHAVPGTGLTVREWERQVLTWLRVEKNIPPAFTKAQFSDGWTETAPANLVSRRTLLAKMNEVSIPA